jgi:hypothetical protein
MFTILYFLIFYFKAQFILILFYGHFDRNIIILIPLTEEIELSRVANR